MYDFKGIGCGGKENVSLVNIMGYHYHPLYSKLMSCIVSVAISFSKGSIFSLSSVPFLN
jgi:hypothetical protein